LAEERNHTLSVSLCPAPLWLEGDEVRLAQVVTNLLNNAAKYTDRGGRIRLTVERAGEEGVVRVKDSGVGIPAAMLAKIFDPFTQVDDTLNRSQGGLGIGLALVKSLVEMHGGSVAVHSDGPGAGSEFVVRLPVHHHEPTPAAEAVDQFPAPVSRRILIVDDSRDAADSLALLLGLSGHEVRTAHDGPAALEAAQAFKPVVVLLDIELPGGVSGYDLAPRLRQLAGLEKSLLVALTGYGQEEDKQKALEAGFDAHMVKPTDLDALLALLAKSQN
jgi:CheY-like chemotaxis protein